MSWEDQGRQEHGWFGDGRAPTNPKDAASGATSINTSRHDLATALAYGAIASMPVAQRARAESAFQGRGLTAFREAMLAWMRGTGMKPEAFADRFFGRSADDPVVQALRDAAELAMTSTTPADMAAASGKAADAMQRVGPDRWSRFLADAQNRARDPATEAAIKASLNPPDAIKPVYLVEAAIGIGVAGAAGGIAAAARALGGAVLRQVRPNGTPQSPASADVPQPEGNPTPLAANRAGFQEYTDGLRRSMDRPATTDPKLSAIMDEMYRPNAKVGSGSTAAAVRAEKATGQPVAGKWHSQKAEESVIRIQNWLRANPTASPSDRAAAENVLRDLQNALAGK